MTALQRLAVAAAALAGFVSTALAVSLFALSFGDSLFGWHDNVGPELALGLLGGCVGAAAAGAWCANRFAPRAPGPRP